jgi:hypothetical protein
VQGLRFWITRNLPKNLLLIGISADKVEGKSMPDIKPSQDALNNIEEACKLFYSNLEMQIALANQQRAGILDLAIRAFAGSEGSGANLLSESLKKTAGNLPEIAKDTAAAPVLTAAGVAPVPSEDESALTNLTNVVKNINLLMQNAIAGSQQLDVLGEAVLARSVELVLDDATGSRAKKAAKTAVAG